MKYLKPYNESNFFEKEDIQEIEDIFQDTADEFNIERIFKSKYHNSVYYITSKSTTQYVIINSGDFLSLTIRSRIKYTKTKLLKYHDKSSEPYPDFTFRDEIKENLKNNFIPRIEKIGYKLISLLEDGKESYYDDNGELINVWSIKMVIEKSS